MEEIKAVGAAWQEKYGDKPVKPYYDNGKFMNAHIEGAWPFDIFLNDFFCGVDYANAHNTIKRRAAKRKNKK